MSHGMAQATMQLAWFMIHYHHMNSSAATHLDVYSIINLQLKSTSTGVSDDAVFTHFVLMTRWLSMSIIDANYIKCKSS